MVPVAPRYSRRILAAVRRLDDTSQPIAETCRRVGEAAERMGLPRPSYSHLRRIVRDERARRDELRRRRTPVTDAIAAGRIPRADDVMRLVEE